jgi:iron complex outermembrane receptor protein
MFFDYVDLLGNGETKSKSFEMFTPRAAMVVSLTDKLTLKTIVGQAFRTPTPTEMFGYNTYTLASNLAELKPEVVTNVDLGLIWEPSANYGFRANAFWLNFENQIAYSVANANLSTNIYTLQTAGFELESRFSFGQFSGFANFTMATRMDETIKDTTITASPSDVTWAPATTFNLGLNYKIQKFSASLLGRYHGKMVRRQSDIYDGMSAYRPEKEVDGWFIADLKATYSVTREIDLGLSVKNILDTERYFIKNNAYPFDYRLGGRQIFAELVIRL